MNCVSTMWLVARYATLPIGMVAVMVLLGIFVRLVSADTSVRAATGSPPSMRDVVLGRARYRDADIEDGLIHAGLIFARKAGRLEVSTRLSRSTLERIFS